MKMRDRRQTPQGTFLALGTDAVPPDGMDLKDVTAPVEADDTKVSRTALNGEGTSEKSDKDNGIVSHNKMKLWKCS